MAFKRSGVRSSSAPPSARRTIVTGRASRPVRCFSRASASAPHRAHPRPRRLRHRAVVTAASDREGRPASHARRRRRARRRCVAARRGIDRRGWAYCAGEGTMRQSWIRIAVMGVATFSATVLVADVKPPIPGRFTPEVWPDCWSCRIVATPGWQDAACEHASLDDGRRGPCRVVTQDGRFQWCTFGGGPCRGSFGELRAYRDLFAPGMARGEAR